MEARNHVLAVPAKQRKAAPMATDGHPDYTVDEQPMLALRRARRAWEASQPQLTLDWEALDGLSEGAKRAAVLGGPPQAAAAPSLSPPNPVRSRRRTTPRGGGLSNPYGEAT